MDANVADVSQLQPYGTGISHMAGLTIISVALLSIVTTAIAAPLVPDPEHLGWGKFPKELSPLTYCSWTPQGGDDDPGTGGIEWGEIVRGAYPDFTSEIFVVNTRPDIDVNVTIDTYFGILNGFCPHMTYVHLGTVPANVDNVACKRTLVKIAHGSGMQPTSNTRPSNFRYGSGVPADVSSILSRNEDAAARRASAIARLKESVGPSVGKEAGSWIVEKVLGRSVGAVASYLSDINMTAPDDTVDGMFQQWQKRCDNFLRDYKIREILLSADETTLRAYNSLLYRDFSTQLKINELSPKVSSLKQQLAADAPAVPWCQDFDEQLRTYLNDRKQRGRNTNP